MHIINLCITLDLVCAFSQGTSYASTALLSRPEGIPSDGYCIMHPINLGLLEFTFEYWVFKKLVTRFKHLCFASQETISQRSYSYYTLSVCIFSSLARGWSKAVNALCPITSYVWNNHKASSLFDHKECGNSPYRTFAPRKYFLQILF